MVQYDMHPSPRITPKRENSYFHFCPDSCMDLVSNPRRRTPTYIREMVWCRPLPDVFRLRCKPHAVTALTISHIIQNTEPEVQITQKQLLITTQITIPDNYVVL